MIWVLVGVDVILKMFGMLWLLSVVLFLGWKVCFFWFIEMLLICLLWSRLML